MDSSRRRQLLQNYLIRYNQDLEREVKSKEGDWGTQSDMRIQHVRYMYMYVYVVSGLEKMVDVYEAKPDFADAETMDSTRRKLSHVRCH